MCLISIHWLEQRDVDLPPGDDWLSPRELSQLGGLCFPKRRADWLLGRWTAKRAVAAYLRLCQDPQALKRIEIRPALSGAPEVHIGEKPPEVSISLSHRQAVAMCVVAPVTSKLGCDLEVIESHCDAFIRDYFTPKEQLAIDDIADEGEKCRAVALVWSAKESALKAMTLGLRLDTRTVSVTLADTSIGCTGWKNLQVRGSDGWIFDGWWQQSGPLLRTVVANSKSRVPIRLDALRSCFSPT